MSFLHGVETLQVDDGIKVISTPATAVIGVAGCNGIGGTSVDPSILGVPQLITPSRTLEDQGLDEDWEVYRAIDAIFSIASPVVIWVPYGTDTAGDRDTTIEQAVDGFLLSRNLLNIAPKILITDDPANAPSAKLVEVAGKLRAVVPVDIDADSAAEMITARASYASAREYLVGPNLLIDGVEYPYSWIMAAMMASTDDEFGYQYSPSNKIIPTVTGSAFPVTASLTDASAETNILNAQGIATVFSGFATGYRTWGNRNASFPVASGIETFVSVVRTRDVIEDAIEAVSLQWVDKPLNNALIDSVEDSVNAFFRDKIGEGVIVDGRAYLDPAKNSATELSNGHLVVSYEFVPPPPLERLTFRSFININLLAKLLED